MFLNNYDHDMQNYSDIDLKIMVDSEDKDTMDDPYLSLLKS